MNNRSQSEQTNRRGALGPHSGRMRLPYFEGRELGDDGFGGAEAVNGGADDAAGVAGAFSHGVEALDAGGLTVHIIANDAHRGAAASFRGGQNRVFQKAAMPAP